MFKNNIKKNWQIPKYHKLEFASKKHDYCVCVPVINEGQKIRRQLSEMKFLTSLIDLIICDGGSTDRSLDTEILKRNNVRVLLIKEDKGKLSAQLRMGYSYAINQGYKGIITIDGNEKDGIDAIPTIVGKLKDGYDFIQASRFIKGGNAINTPLCRLLAIKLIHAPIISLIAKKKYTDTTNGFRGYSRKYLLHPEVKPFRAIFDRYELLAYLSVRADQLSLNTTEIPATRKYPKNEKMPTKISPIKGNINLIKTLINLALGKYNP